MGSVMVQSVVTGTNTVILQSSNDGLSWQTVTGIKLSSAPFNGSFSITTSGNYSFSISAKYFRAYGSSVTSGGQQIIMVASPSSGPSVMNFVTGQPLNGTAISTSALGLAGANQSFVFGTAPIPQSGYSSPIGVTSSAVSEVGWTSITQTAYSGLTTNAATTLNITATAGTSAYKQYLVRISVDAGATSIRAITHNTVTVPTTFSATSGPQYYLGDTASFTGPPIEFSGVNTSPHLSMYATALSGATSGTVYVTIFGR
jgi:hypothetical protein